MADAPWEPAAGDVTDAVADRLRRLDAGMTPAPWHAYGEFVRGPRQGLGPDDLYSTIFTIARCVPDTGIPWDQGQKEARGIVALRNAAPALLGLLPHVRHAPECAMHEPDLLPDRKWHQRPCDCGRDDAMAALVAALPEAGG